MKNLIAWIVTSLFLLLSSLSKGSDTTEQNVKKDTYRSYYSDLTKEKDGLKNRGLIKKNR
ncbi:hypothetical protein SAMN05660841_01002 [Sphingobacterium nematocida]|uniref:Uncharacterized protein n=1 Tax=Sphingobacterium nematocida TaxID=1513896 RepID=A0A1T5C0N6_9SPHI|nr:hypothetical protein SAMN05660841_01002 [Sphingobacterium nematocida]